MSIADDSARILAARERQAAEQRQAAHDQQKAMLEARIALPVYPPAWERLLPSQREQLERLEARIVALEASNQRMAALLDKFTEPIRWVTAPEGKP